MTTAKPASTTADLIRTRGVKATPARVRVLEILSAAEKPMSHADIDTALLSGGGPAMDKVTLYRVLDALVAKELALKAVDTHGVFRYSDVAAKKRHAGHVHFHCLDCGEMFCLKAKAPEPPRLPRGFRLRDVEFDVRGTCPDCAGALPAATR